MLRVVRRHKIKFYYIAVNILSRITVENFRIIPINLNAKIRPWLLSRRSRVVIFIVSHDVTLRPSKSLACRYRLDCGIAPINSGRLHNVPLYKRRTKILSHPPPNRVTPVFGTQIFHVDTFDINSIRQGLVPIHGSAVFIRVTRRARSSAFSLPYTVTGQLFTRPAPESLYMDCMCFSLPLCDPGRSIWTSSQTSTANFPLLRGHFTGPQVCLSDRHRLRHLYIKKHGFATSLNEARHSVYPYASRTVESNPDYGFQ